MCYSFGIKGSSMDYSNQSIKDQGQTHHLIAPPQLHHHSGVSELTGGDGGYFSPYNASHVPVSQHAGVSVQCKVYSATAVKPRMSTNI